MAMEREAMILYLQNVRDLEVAKERTKRLWSAAQYKRDKLLSNLPLKIEKMKMPVREDYVKMERSSAIIAALIGGILFGGPFFLLGRSLDRFGFGSFFYLTGIIVIIYSGYWAFARIEEIEKSEREFYSAISEYERYNKTAETQEEINKSKRDEVRKEFDSQIAFYKKEYRKVDKILNDFYSMNIIPSQFRDLSSIIYIYDYMSTSQATLEATLFQTKMEEGIQRIERKLDLLIDRLNELIRETRCLRRENRKAVQRQIDANNSMLNNLKRIASNTADAAAYGELAANYAAANAYFSMVEYFK